MSIAAFGYSMEALRDEFRSSYGKGKFHSDAFFRHLYAYGNADASAEPEFRSSLRLAETLAGDFEVSLPEISSRNDDVGTVKYALRMADGSVVESVHIPMAEWSTLCVSSQVGCARACAFCETARMGFVRNLAAEEMVAQWAVLRFEAGAEPRNIVFMGMGEPFDNFDAVVRAVDILSDPRGPDIPKRRISVSTAGHVDGIRRLARLEDAHPDAAYRTLHLAVSLNAPDDALRDRLMPINRLWPLAELKSALLEAPQCRIKDALYIEYVLIPGVNDGDEHAEKLIRWMEGMEAKVNLIPYHPRGQSPWEAPGDETVDRFHGLIRSAGRECRTRKSRGRGIAAACGMLGRRSPGSRTADLS
jgi:23S rRNA (adenine2503-C2)-methyltransferase